MTSRPGARLGHLHPWGLFRPAVVAVGMLIAFGGEYFLPDKYFFDQRGIQAMAQGKVSEVVDPNFARVAAVYRFLGLGELTVLAGAIGFALWVWCAIVLVGRRCCTPSALQLTMQALCFIIGSVYLSGYSKDVFVLAVTACVLTASDRLRGDLLIVCVGLTYAALLRPYWFLVLGLFVLFRLLLARGISWWRLLASVCLAMLALSLAFRFGQHTSLGAARIAVNASREDDPFAVTSIHDYFAGFGVAPGFVNGMLVLVGFFFPLTLALTGGGSHLVLAAVIGFMWIVFWRAVHRGVLSVHVPVERSVVRAIAMLLSLTVVQTSFEPDFGSYLRHLSPLMPLLLLVVMRLPSTEPRTSVDGG